MLLEFLNDPQWLHAAAVHLPIALSVLGVPLVYLTAVAPREKEILRVLATATYVLLILLALGAVWTGEQAAIQVPPTLPGEVWDTVEKHEEMAEVVWIFAAVTAVLLALSALPIRWFRGTVMALAMVASLGTAGWVALTGHYGGTLVYSHGVGTPGRALNRMDTGTPTIPPAQAVPTPPPAVEPEPVPPPPAVEPTPVAPAPVPAPAEPVPTEATPPAPAPVPTPEVPVTPAPADSGAPAGDGFVPALRSIDPDQAAKVSYLREVKPIMQEYCIDCHDSESAKGNLSVETVADMMKPGEKGGPGVVPFKPDDSAVVQYIRGIKQPRMPRKREPLNEEQLHVIRMWIAAGAQDDSAAPPPPGPDSALPPGTTAEPRPVEPVPAPAPESTPPAPAPADQTPAEGSLRAQHGNSGQLITASRL